MRLATNSPASVVAVTVITPFELLPGATEPSQFSTVYVAMNFS